MKWTVARFPNGSWSSGGKPDSKEYQSCEVFVVDADSREKATKKGQSQRSRQRRRDGLLPAISCKESEL